MTEPLRGREPWFVPLGLLILGGIGVMYHQLLLWCWRLGGVGPVDRRTFGGAIALLLIGALFSWGESPQVRLLRRFLLAAALGGAAWLHWAWRADLCDGTWGWVALIACGLCGGGEVYWLFRAVWDEQTSPPGPLFRMFAIWLPSVVLPSMLMPYLGVLPGCLAYAAVGLGWTLWGLGIERGDSWQSRSVVAASVIWAACACVAFTVPGAFVSEKGFLPVDRSPSRHMALETSRRVDVLWVRGGWRGQRRWEYQSSDAHRWAEALVHPAMSDAPPRARVLLLGGEDGTALREILRHVNVAQVDVWSDRPARLGWLRHQPLLARRLGHPFRDERVVERAFRHRWELMRQLQRKGRGFDRIFLALDRPWSGARRAGQARLFGLLRKQLTPGGKLAGMWGELKPVTHFACMLRAVAKAGLQPRPYRSLGTGITWGLFVAGEGAAPAIRGASLPPGLRYLRPKRMEALLQFPPDADPGRAPTHICDE